MHLDKRKMPKYNRLLFVFRHLFTIICASSSVGSEHQTFNLGVPGSSPGWRTKKGEIPTTLAVKTVGESYGYEKSISASRFEVLRGMAPKDLLLVQEDCCCTHLIWLG